MSFDLLTYADEHRYRVRNLHDGDPVPPTRRRCNGRRRAVYRGADDRDDAIICRDGYVPADDSSEDRVGFCVLCRSSRALQAPLRVLQRLGAVITQLGDSEAVGHAPVSQIGEVLKALRVYRRRETPVGARVHGPESTQSGRAGVDRLRARKQPPKARRSDSRHANNEGRTMSVRTGKGAELYDNPFAWLGAVFRIAFVRYELGKLSEELEVIVPTFDDSAPPEDRGPWTMPLYHLARASASLGRLSSHLQQPLLCAETRRKQKRTRKAKRPRRASPRPRGKENTPGGPIARNLNHTPRPAGRSTPDLTCVNSVAFFRP
jgi:hypothetical protein